MAGLIAHYEFIRDLLEVFGVKMNHNEIAAFTQGWHGNEHRCEGKREKFLYEAVRKHAAKHREGV